jgi:hypothetical protein
MSTRWISAVASLALLASLGCSFWDSSRSVSKTASSPFEWSSDSSSPDSVAYREDVRDYTYAYVRSGGDLTAFQRGIGELAERRGVAHWERDEVTCAGIGAGLRKAELDGDQAQTFAESLFGSGSDSVEGVRRGYEAGF